MPGNFPKVFSTELYVSGLKSSLRYEMTYRVDLMLRTERLVMYYVRKASLDAGRTQAAFAADNEDVQSMLQNW